MIAWQQIAPRQRLVHDRDHLLVRRGRQCRLDVGDDV